MSTTDTADLNFEALSPIDETIWCTDETVKVVFRRRGGLVLTLRATGETYRLGECALPVDNGDVLAHAAAWGRCSAFIAMNRLTPQE